MEDATEALPASLTQRFRELSSKLLWDMGWKATTIKIKGDSPTQKFMRMSVEEFNKSFEDDKLDKEALQEIKKYLGEEYSKTDTDSTLNALRTQILIKTQSVLDALQEKEKDIENKRQTQQKIEEDRKKEKLGEIQYKLQEIAIADKNGKTLGAVVPAQQEDKPR